MKKPQFVQGGIYHIYNRGVEKRKVFLDKTDHYRFIRDLYELNDEEPTYNSVYYSPIKFVEVKPRQYKGRKPRKLLVDILAFVLMPNHFHLLLRQRKENGIIRFMQKLGTGYTMYFNKRYERVGGLFQGSYKAVAATEEAHFTYLPLYIHLNPIKIYRGSTSTRGMINFLRNYKWSSFPDYIGKRNFPSVTSREFFLEFFGGEKNVFADTHDFIKNKKEFSDQAQEVIIDDD